MEMNLKINTLILVFLVTILSGCHKEGKGGKASVNGKAAHHGFAIPNCVIYIKYGATELPGTSPSAYDDSVVADANGNYAFKDLYKGDYYLYGIGYDNSIMDDVKGGVGIKLNKNKAFTIDVPVTE